MKKTNSEMLYERACKLIPGGVNSPVRACRSVGTYPLFIERAEGSRIYDVDGHAYIDYVGSWGPMILGHRHPQVIDAVENVLSRGLSFGAPIDLEIELAQLIIDAVPSIDMVRMVNSGTEATMSAIRLARAFTNRDTIIKFDGCYHGHADTLLVDAGSGVATLAIPGSPGIPESIVAHTISLPYNDIQAVETLMSKKGKSIAAIIVEPVAGNMGLVLPKPEFLKYLRDITKSHGTLLIFDEVMTGFRVSYGGAQELYNIDPDITCLGKIIGGGLPVGAYGGKKHIMEMVAPQGQVYQAGTLSGNPVAMAAGIATLKTLHTTNPYAELSKKTEHLVQGMTQLITKTGKKATASCVGSMFGLFFTDQPITNFKEAKTSNLAMFKSYYTSMLSLGIYLAPSQFEAGFVSTAHSDEDIATTLTTFQTVMEKL
ncbi:MAG: glutamate-1-semialdehyde 2,1-aminomutase [Desulfobacterales bacterium]|nr:glutamate-1-semialdehyde 2,1-aminomutase [Desulfobacterales bacterium]